MDEFWRRGSTTLLRLSERSCARFTAVAADARRVSAFLRGRLEFRPRHDDIYVVTYPRSGTTWLLYMLHLLIRDDRSFEHLSDVCPWFERSLAIGTHQAADFERLASPRLFKSHLSFGWLPPLGRKIYVVRDGGDVAVSYWHFYRSHLGFRGDFSEFFERFMHGKLQYGSWFKHVAGWQRHGGESNVLIVTFQDLLDDTPKALRRIAAFLRLSPSQLHLEAALQHGTFEAMKRDEGKFDHVTSLLRERGIRSDSFLRQGRAGSGQQALSAQQAARLRERAKRAERAWKRPDLEVDLAAFLH